MTKADAVNPPSGTLDTLIAATLGLFAFSVVFSVTVMQGSILLLLLLLFIKNYRQGSLPALRAGFTGHPLFIPWAVYLGVCLLTAITSYYPSKGFSQLNSDFLKYLCFASLSIVIPVSNLRKTGVIYLSAALLAALYGIGEVAGLIPADNPDPTRADAFMNAVRYGEVMGIAFLFSLSRLLMPAGAARREYLFNIFCAAAIFFALLLSKTRGAYFGVIMGGAVLMFFSGMRKRSMLLLLFSLAAAAVLTVKAVPSVAIRFSGIKTLAVEILAPGSSQYSRVQMWWVGAKMVKDHPILGVGPDNIKRVFKDFSPELVHGQAWSNLHSLYIHQLAERGLLGLGALLFLLFSMLRYARARFKAGNPHALWALCVLPAFYVMNLTEVSFQHAHTSFAVFLSLAFAAAGRQTDSR